MRPSFCTALIAVALILAFAPRAAEAATAQRAFVASNGNDANICSIVAPCRSFGTAITHTSTGGEVIVLDSAGYGPVTIGKAVSIIAPDGVYAGISVASGDGITVNAPGAFVQLRGLAINKQGATSASAIIDDAAGKLLVERCQITGFNLVTDKGIEMDTSADPSELVVINSTLSNNEIGIHIFATSGTPSVLIDGTRFTGNRSSLAVGWTARVTLHASQMLSDKVSTVHAIEVSADPVELHLEDSVIDGAGVGVDATLLGDSYISISVDRTTVTHTTYGMTLQLGASAAIANSTFTHNDAGVMILAGSALFTGGTTYMAYNGGGNVVGPGNVQLRLPAISETAASALRPLVDDALRLARASARCRPARRRAPPRSRRSST